MANFRVQPELVGRIMSRQKDDLQLVQLVDKVKKSGKSNFFLLIIGTRRCVPSDEDLRRELLEKAHCSRLVIHPRGTKMYKDLK